MNRSPLLLSLLLLLPLYAFAQGFPTPETVGHLGGFAQTLVVRDDLAYISRANVFAVLDLSVSPPRRWRQHPGRSRPARERSRPRRAAS